MKECSPVTAIGGVLHGHAIITISVLHESIEEDIMICGLKVLNLWHKLPWLYGPLGLSTKIITL